MDIKDSKLDFLGSFRKDNKNEYIIIHHALAKNCTIEDVHRWHLDRGWNGCGYHYFIKKGWHSL